MDRCTHTSTVCEKICLSFFPLFVQYTSIESDSVDKSTNTNEHFLDANNSNNNNNDFFGAISQFELMSHGMKQKQVKE